MRLGAGLLLLCGCEVLFPLAPDPDAPPPEPAPCPIEPTVSCGIDGPDEDGDARKDACDPCPQIADGDADLDGDGIGDDCDPAPEVPATCNVRRFFGLGSDEGWLDPTGWTFDDEASNPSDTLAVLRSSELRGAGRVETVVADQNPFTSDSLAGVVLLASDNGGYLCVVHPTGGGLGTLVLAELAGAAERVLAESTRFGLTPGRIHRVQLSIRDDGRVVCRSDGGGDQDPVLELDAELDHTPDALPAIGSFGLAIRGMAESNFRYLDFIPN